MRPLGLLLIGALAAAGCGDGGPGPDDLPEGTISLGVGEVKTVDYASATLMHIYGGTAGAEFTLVPVFVADVAAGEIALDVSGEQLTAPVGPPSPQLRALEGGIPRAGDLRRASEAERFEASIRQLEREMLSTRRVGMPAPSPQFRAPHPPAAITGGPPAVGEEMVLNASAFSACRDPRWQTGHVAAVTQHAVIVGDDANPTGGFTSTEYEEIGREFDALVHPVVTENFGAPSDIDENDRIVIFFTRAVNELTPPGSTSQILGFIFVRDLLPNEGSGGCAGSNRAELFYLRSADPAGEVNGNVLTKETARKPMASDLAHHYQHLINAARRMEQNASVLEDNWLNDGLSHIAEELVFYRAAALGPRQNIALQTLQSSATIAEAAEAYQRENFLELMDYLEDPEGSSPYGDWWEFETHGAAWQLLRYAADRRGGVERNFWMNLVNSPFRGRTNLSAAVGMDFSSLVRDWAIAQYTDDAGFQTASTLQHPSWSFRSILPSMHRDSRFPLRVQALASGSSSTVTLRDGGVAYLRFAVPAAGLGTIRVRAAAGFESAEALADLSLSIVRTK